MTRLQRREWERERWREFSPLPARFHGVKNSFALFTRASALITPQWEHKGTRADALFIGSIESSPRGGPFRLMIHSTTNEAIMRGYGSPWIGILGILAAEFYGYALRDSKLIDCVGSWGREGLWKGTTLKWFLFFFFFFFFLWKNGCTKANLSVLFEIFVSSVYKNYKDFMQKSKYDV